MLSTGILGKTLGDTSERFSYIISDRFCTQKSPKLLPEEISQVNPAGKVSKSWRNCLENHWRHTKLMFEEIFEIEIEELKNRLQNFIEKCLEKFHRKRKGKKIGVSNAGNFGKNFRKKNLREFLKEGKNKSKAMSWGTPEGTIGKTPLGEPPDFFLRICLRNFRISGTCRNLYWEILKESPNIFEKISPRFAFFFGEMFGGIPAEIPGEIPARFLENFRRNSK